MLYYRMFMRAENSYIQPSIYGLEQELENGLAVWRTRMDSPLSAPPPSFQIGLKAEAFRSISFTPHILSPPFRLIYLGKIRSSKDIMQDYIYSTIALVAMVIHLIINSSPRAELGMTAAHGEREYRFFLKGIFAYYVADAAWGILAGLGWTRLLYIDTMLYYIAIAVSALTWCHFVVTYLDFSGWKARILPWFGYALLSLYVVLLVANIFTNCLFHFDENGHYSAGFIRYLIVYPLVALNILMAICALMKARSSQDSMRRRNLVVFLFSLTMAVTIVLQIIWPLWPFYALGCLIGNCFFHTFVVEDERNELRRAVIEREQTAKHMAELEKALERARSAEKSRSMFFNIVSHDIRTPLNAILGYSELLQFGNQSEKEKNEALQSIRASGTTLLELVNDVLDLAKMDSGKMTLQRKAVRLADLTDDVFASFRLTTLMKGIELVNRTGDVPIVMLDAHRFRQILFNLVGNAVKFTNKGTVTVAASYAEKSLRVSVSDTGCGIASDMLTHILDPFVQVQDPSHASDRTNGTGLGLSICRRLVEVMGGELTVESELGKGSTFRATIPGVEVSGDKAEPIIAPTPIVELKNLPKHVLVVDDSPVNRSVLTAFLKRAGVVLIDHTCDGEEALSKIRSEEKTDHPFDCVFSDFWMPNMNGLEFIEKLRADPRFTTLPVFALTADTENQSDARTRLFSGLLLKPLTYDKLVGVLATM